MKIINCLCQFSYLNAKHKDRSRRSRNNRGRAFWNRAGAESSPVLLIDLAHCGSGSAWPRNTAYSWHLYDESVLGWTRADCVGKIFVIVA
jgi:hypothetical protein